MVTSTIHSCYFALKIWQKTCWKVPEQGAKIVFKLDTTKINEKTFILPICGLHTLTVYGLLLTKKLKFHVRM